MATFASCDTNPTLRGVPRRVKAVSRMSAPAAGAERIFGAEGCRQARLRRRKTPSRRAMWSRDDWRRRALQERRWKLSLASANVVFSWSPRDLNAP